MSAAAWGEKAASRVQHCAVAAQREDDDDPLSWMDDYDSTVGDIVPPGANVFDHAISWATFYHLAPKQQCRTATAILKRLKTGGFLAIGNLFWDEESAEVQKIVSSNSTVLLHGILGNVNSTNSSTWSTYDETTGWHLSPPDLWNDQRCIPGAEPAEHYFAVERPRIRNKEALLIRKEALLWSVDGVGGKGDPTQPPRILVWKDRQDVCGPDQHVMYSVGTELVDRVSVSGEGGQ